MFAITLTIHVLLALTSTAYLILFAVRAMQQQHTSKQRRIVVAGGIATTLSGVALLLMGASVGRTCLTIAAYSLVTAFVLYASRNQSMTSIDTSPSNP